MLVRAIIEYASTVWDPHTQSNISQIEAVQRRAARFVKGDYRTSSTSQILKSWMANPSRAPHTLEVGDGVQDCTWSSRHSMYGLPPVCYQYQWPLTEVCCPLLQVWHLDIYRHFFLSLGYPAVERATRAHCHCWLPRGLQGSADHPTEEARLFLFLPACLRLRHTHDLVSYTQMYNNAPEWNYVR